MKIGTVPVGVCVLLIILFLFPETNLLAEANFSYDQSEVVLETEIQYDWIDEDCDPENCDEKDGLRVADILLRYNYFTSINSLVFAEANIDLSRNVSTDELLTSFSTNEEYPDSNTVDRAFIGNQIENIEISIGNRKPISTSLSPTTNSYINFDLSAFDDDRFLISSGKVDNIVSRVDWSDRYRIVISSGLAENDNLIPDLNFEILFDAPLFESRGFHISAASRTIDIEGKDDFRASGVKLSLFQNNGNLFELAFSKNDIGEYVEFLFRRDWCYRHRLEFGLSDFDEDLDSNIQEIDVVSDSEFAYLNYTFFISRTLRWFLERSVFDSDSFNRKVWLAGFEFSF